MEDDSDLPNASKGLRPVDRTYRMSVLFYAIIAFIVAGLIVLFLAWT